MEVSVSKYHGCGNDFILIREEEADRIENLQDFIVAVCDRHTGIGADGLIVARTHPFFMEYYNQDGSRAPMCGNGIRCLTKFLVDEKLTDESKITIETLAGTKTVELVFADPFQVRVNMGKPFYDPAAIDVRSEQPIWDFDLQLDDQTKKIFSFFMSTTHTVVFDEDAMGDIEKKGKEICFHPMFEKETNVNFVNVLDPENIQVQTFERGCGVTLACGTGVCASALCAHKNGLCDSKVDVEMKKGHLQIEIEPDETVYMSGPAKRILKGTFDYSK